MLTDVAIKVNMPPMTLACHMGTGHVLADPLPISLLKARKTRENSSVIETVKLKLKHIYVV